MIASELSAQQDELARRLQERKAKAKRVSITKQARLSLKSRSTANMLNINAPVVQTELGVSKQTSEHKEKDGLAKLTNMISPLYQPHMNILGAMESTPSNDSSSLGGGMFPPLGLANINFGNLKFADILGTDDISYFVPAAPVKVESETGSLETSEILKSEDGARSNSQGYVHVEDDAYSYEESKSGSKDQSMQDDSRQAELQAINDKYSQQVA